jgi:splicing factor 3B subunit 3
VIPLEDNEAAFSLAIVPFSARGGELHLVVGTAADTFISPRSCTTGYLRTYKFTDDGAGLEFQHKVCPVSIERFSALIYKCQSETDDIPLAVMAFQGRLVAGVGKALRIYDIGKKKLLRKVENKVGC